MKEEDLRKVISELTTKLREEGLEWVLEEYYETVQAGKIETKLVKFEHWSELDSEFKASGRPKSVTGTIPLSLKEQAVLLISAIENAVVVPNKVVISLNRNLNSFFEDNSLDAIRFEPDLESVEKVAGLEEALPTKMKGFSINFEDEVRKRTRIKKLAALCEELKNSINR